MKNEKTNTKNAGRLFGPSVAVSVVVVVVVVGLLARKSTKTFETTIVTQTQQHLLNIAKTVNAEDIHEPMFHCPPFWIIHIPGKRGKKANSTDIIKI